MCEYNTLVKPLALDCNSKNLKKCLSSVIPEGFFSTVSVKGLGPVLLPHLWFIREYRNQAVLGSHEKIASSEGALLVELYSIIAEFRRGLLILENALFKSIFKYSGNDFRLAVLKIIPKIHKLSHPITLNPLIVYHLRGG